MDEISIQQQQKKNFFLLLLNFCVGLEYFQLIHHHTYYILYCSYAHIITRKKKILCSIVAFVENKMRIQHAHML